MAPNVLLFWVNANFDALARRYRMWIHSLSVFENSMRKMRARNNGKQKYKIVWMNTLLDCVGHTHKSVHSATPTRASMVNLQRDCAASHTQTLRLALSEVERGVLATKDKERTETGTLVQKGAIVRF